MCREYYLHTRNGIFYVQFRNPENGELLTARSTGETDQIKAIEKIGEWKVGGIPTGRTRKPRPIEEAAGIEAVIRLIRKSDLNADDALRIVQTLKGLELIDIAAVKNTGAGAVQFVEYLKSFWDFDKSEYVKNRLAHGKKIGRNHAHQCMLRVNSILTDFFGDKKLNCVTNADLRHLSSFLYECGLSTSTINQIMLSAGTPLKWAFEHGIIPSNPCLGLDKFKIESKECGILSDMEAAEVYGLNTGKTNVPMSRLLSQ